MSRYHKFLITFLYITVLAYLVFFSGHRSDIQSRSINMFPVAQRLNELRLIKHHQGWGILKFAVNFFGNILMFIPLPMVALQLFPSLNNWAIVLLAFILSISIEICQFIFERGITDIDDISLNVVGAIAGLVVYKMYTRWKDDYLQAIKS